MPRRALVGLLAALALVGAAGCGLGAGPEKHGKGAQLSITRDFGQRELAHSKVAKVREGQTVMRLLRGSHKISTRYGGGFVQSIDGLKGTGRGGGQDWFFYVNGIAADRGASDYDLHPGDVVQWDYRNWRGAQDVRAIVGGFPEPFVHGIGGKSYPVRVECQDVEGKACRRVKDNLQAEGVAATGATLGTPGVQNVARVVVATWPRARQLPSLRPIGQGPKRSGVFARFDGSNLELLDQRGSLARRAGPDTGLIAALRPSEMELVWVVTGGSEGAVERAARDFDAEALRGVFALAVPAVGRPVDLPVGAGG
jgi:hypothetical protein